MATVAVAVTWALNLETELAKLRLPVKQDLTLINALDLFHLVLVPLLTGLRLGESLLLVDLTGATSSLVAFGVGLLQVTLWGGAMLTMATTLLSMANPTCCGQPYLVWLTLLTVGCRRSRWRCGC